MSCCGPSLTPDQADEVSRAVAEKLAAFLKTLRAHVFALQLWRCFLFLLA